VNHKKVVANVSNFIDGELDPGTQAELKKHIKACPRCRIYVDTLKKTIVLYQVKDCPQEVPK